MPTGQTPEKEVYVVYSLINDRGIYSKNGTIINETENTVKFETTSETYRIVEEEYIERKQRCGWYKLGSIKKMYIDK